MVWNALLAPFILKEKLTRCESLRRCKDGAKFGKAFQLFHLMFSTPFLELPDRSRGSCFGSLHVPSLSKLSARHRLVGSILVMTGSIGSACFGNQEDEMTKWEENEGSQGSGSEKKKRCS